MPHVYTPVCTCERTCSLISSMTETQLCFVLFCFLKGECFDQHRQIQGYPKLSMLWRQQWGSSAPKTFPRQAPETLHNKLFLRLASQLYLRLEENWMNNLLSSVSLVIIKEQECWHVVKWDWVSSMLNYSHLSCKNFSLLQRPACVCVINWFVVHLCCCDIWNWSLCIRIIAVLVISRYIHSYPNPPHRDRERERERERERDKTRQDYFIVRPPAHNNRVNIQFQLL